MDGLLFPSAIAHSSFSFFLTAKVVFISPECHDCYDSLLDYKRVLGGVIVNMCKFLLPS